MTITTYIPILVLLYYIYKENKRYKQLEIYVDYLEVELISSRNKLRNNFIESQSLDYEDIDHEYINDNLATKIFLDNVCSNCGHTELA